MDNFKRMGELIRQLQDLTNTPIVALPPTFPDDPGEACPEPATDLETVWAVVRGSGQRLAGTPLHQAFLGASPRAVYWEDAEHGETVIVDFTEEEGIHCQVHHADGHCWEVPLDGSAPVLLHWEEDADPLGNWHGRNA